MQIRSFHGHGPGRSVRLLLPHAHLPLLASIDSSGDLILWDCSFACCDERLFESAVDVESGAPRWLFQMPGTHDAAVWPTRSALLLVLRGSGLELLVRSSCTAPATVQWKLDCCLPFLPGSAPPESVLHRDRPPPLLGVFAQGAAASSQSEPPHATATGFAVLAGRNVAVWVIGGVAGEDRTLGKEHSTAVCWAGEASLGLPSGAIACCAAPLPVDHIPSQSLLLRGGGYGTMVVAYNDGSVCLWSLKHSSGGLEAVPGSCLRLCVPPKMAHVTVSSMCASGDGGLLRVALVSWCQSQTTGAGNAPPPRHAAQLRLLEFSQCVSKNRTQTCHPLVMRARVTNPTRPTHDASHPTDPTPT